MVGGTSLVIGLADTLTVSFFVNQLAYRDKEVDVKVKHVIDLVEPFDVFWRVVALVANNLTDPLAVFLLDVWVVVLLVGTASRESIVVFFGKT